jgi:hypothetical protein
LNLINLITKVNLDENSNSDFSYSCDRCIGVHAV